MVKLRLNIPSFKLVMYLICINQRDLFSSWFGFHCFVAWKRCYNSWSTQKVCLKDHISSRIYSCIPLGGILRNTLQTKTPASSLPGTSYLPRISGGLIVPGYGWYISELTFNDRHLFGSRRLRRAAVVQWNVNSKSCRADKENVGTQPRTNTSSSRCKSLPSSPTFLFFPRQVGLDSKCKLLASE